jgi:NAD(P)-dependent dehydrogenase (short-subunit alcohol dehydrogenase family)
MRPVRENGPQMESRDLSEHVALVAGATRGAGRAIAIELGALGATVYCTGRTTRTERSPMGRPETIDATAELVTAAGGTGIAARVDHTSAAEVEALVARIAGEQAGRLDVLVNSLWGGDRLTGWGTRFWEHSLEDGLEIQRHAVSAHLITAWHAVPLMVAAGRGLVVEMTDGDGTRYEGQLFYDLAKTANRRIAFDLAADLRPHGITVVAVAPGFLRSEAMLDHFGVSEATWREGIAQDEHFAQSETPRYVGRGIAALAADPSSLAVSGRTLWSAELARTYDVEDVDGRRPDWPAYFATLNL